jgi:hypothetical protein
VKSKLPSFAFAAMLITMHMPFARASDEPLLEQSMTCSNVEWKFTITAARPALETVAAVRTSGATKVESAEIVIDTDKGFQVSLFGCSVDGSGSAYLTAGTGGNCATCEWMEHWKIQSKQDPGGRSTTRIVRKKVRSRELPIGVKRHPGF